MDYKGNEVQDGDEICFVKIRKNYEFKNFAWNIPDGKGGYTEHKIPDTPEEDCFEPYDYRKVFIQHGQLYTTIQCGEYTFSVQLKNTIIFLDKYTLLAIKGKSDFK